MPARSNIFQRLVAEIHRDLGAHWNVTESRLLRDTRTGQEREVDVVAEGVVGGYTIIIAIEVRDRGRPADVTWVESMVQKHADLPTSRLVLWSSSGFSVAARSKAQSLKAEAVQPTDGAGVEWANLARRTADGFLKVVNVTFETVIDVSLEDGTGTLWPADNTTELISKDGTVAGRIGTILEGATPHLRSAVLTHAREGAGNFSAEFIPPLPCTVVGPGREQGCVRCVVFYLATQTSTARLDTRSVLHRDTVVGLAEARFDECDVRIVTREAEAGVPVIAAVRVPKR